MMLIQFGVLIVSLAGLIFFADKLVDASARIAKAFGISDVVIGLTLLAYGTSLPEFAVSSIAAFEVHPELSISNIIGSNIFNVAFILGAAALIRPLVIKDTHLATRDGSIMVLTALFLIFLLFYFNEIGRIVGCFMVLSLGLYTYYVLTHDKTPCEKKGDTAISKARESCIALGCLLMVLVCGRFTISSAIEVARGLRVTEWLIGATIVAAGTSLPETVVSISAARKGFFGMSIGNIVGSNIFNVLWILGFAAMLHPLVVYFDSIKWDSLFLIVITVLFACDLIRRRISRLKGAVYLAIYLGYVAYLLTMQRLPIPI